MKKIILLLLLSATIAFGQNSFDRWVPTSGTNTYTTNITGFPSSYNNTTIYLKFGNANSGASTIAVNGLSAQTIKLWDGDSWEALVAGNIPAGSNGILTYDNTNSFYKAIIYENIGGGGSVSMSDLTDVSFTGLAANDFLKYNGTNWINRTPANVKVDLSLDNVENTALSTWAGSTNLTTLGTIGTGTWNGSVISATYGGTGLSALGSGVATWLGTPSWTNFNSAITGTAPFWSLASGGTATGANTFTHNTAGWLNFSGAWTASANSQISRSFTDALTMRATASDVVTANYFNPTFNLGSTSQAPIGLNLDVTYAQTGGVSTTVAGTATTTGMTATTYTNVAPASTSGSGTGALFTVVVGSSTSITSVTQTTAGSGYKVMETITFNGNQFGSGSGSAPYTIRTVTGVSLASTASTLRVGLNGAHYLDSPHLIDFYNAGAYAGAVGLSNLGGAFTQAIGFYDGTSVNFSYNHANGLIFAKAVTASSTLSVTGTTALNGAVTLGAGGSMTSAYINPVNGVSTSSAYNYTGTSGGIATTNNFQSKYRVTGTIGSGVQGVGIPSAISLTSGGTGYTTGAKATTGGTGTGFQVTVNTVSSGVVTAVSFTSLVAGAANGYGYTVGDVVTLSTGGANATVTITAVDYAGSIIAFDDVSSFTDARSNNLYHGFYSRPTYNITSTQSSGEVYAVRHKSTDTNLGSFAKGNFVYENSGSKGGIGNTLTNTHSSWDVNGSAGTSIVTSTGDLTLDITNHTVIITSGTGTYTIPAASSATRRTYVLVNHTGTARTISTYTDKTGSTATTIAANTALWIQSDGSNWYQIN